MRQVESETDRGVFVDQSASRKTTLGDLIDIYLKEVTDQRPGESSRIADLGHNPDIRLTCH
ncbi:hypothetical protein HW532_08430 [Kaustia mangrovi]|uniref:Uncharacterized protein n=1 Tax=Kaustia mangrovi TaxID=2593653 RepID=A0A7S8HBL9_9HYPH|nr:hypothetical protein [Kaustia mangrovi]QPC42720.1 hypothetical protein HW532_08430 [Kaustia mangrovi]